MVSDPPGRRSVTPEHLAVGTVLLQLIADWDSWVARRVDSFSFAGDDERQLHRHQSVDFAIPTELWDGVAASDLPLLDRLGGFPVPVTFVRKWRLPQFSLRDRSADSVSLLHREESVLIGAAMLISLGILEMEGKIDLERDSEEIPAMPAPLVKLLESIPAGERTESLLRCADLTHPDWSEAEQNGPDLCDWRETLLRSEAFMSLAYELAAGFPLIAAMDRRDGPRQILKFSYNSYVLEPGRDPLRIWARHLGRRLRLWSRDAIDPAEWTHSSSRRRVGSDPAEPGETGRLVLSTLCEETPEGLNPPSSSTAAVLVSICGPRGRWTALPPPRRRQNVRMRPSGVVVLDGLPPGDYAIRVRAKSGHEVPEGDRERSVSIAPGEVTRLHLRTRRTAFSKKPMRAPAAVGSPSPTGVAIMRGLGWRSKTLAIRVRSGEGGSYHCEFEAPPGLHVTRARLISNREGNADGRLQNSRAEGAKRPHDVDAVLKSAQRAHLYAPAKEPDPFTGYAMLNLRPRIETIVRPALITAVAVAAVLLFVALWGVPERPENGKDETPWTLLALVLGGPGALAAYVAQAVPSRVTNSMLWGLRLLALVPTALSFAAAAVLLLNENPQTWIWVLFGLTCGSVVVLASTHFLAEHPREQGPNDYRQGLYFERRYAATPFGGAEGDETQLSARSAYRFPANDDPAAAMRDRMLERIGGMSHSTRRIALRERWFKWWEREVPPALYFDSAESPAIFLGLGERELDTLEGGVRSLLNNLRREVAAAS
jgi:hypothetical protein